MTSLFKTKKKLAITGDYSYFVTLPKEWVKHLGWRSKQGLELEIKEKRGEIVIRDYPN